MPTQFIALREKIAAAKKYLALLEQEEVRAKAQRKAEDWTDANTTELLKAYEAQIRQKGYTEGFNAGVLAERKECILIAHCAPVKTHGQDLREAIANAIRARKP